MFLLDRPAEGYQAGPSPGLVHFFSFDLTSLHKICNISLIFHDFKALGNWGFLIKNVYRQLNVMGTDKV